MVLFNHATREMTAKIVYYGPGLCGKTTNLLVIFDKLDPRQKGKMLSLATKTDRTLFFDLLPVDIGKVGAFNLKIQLYTVPGQVFYNETRKLVLKGADSVVFVADSQPAMVEANRESFANLLDNLQDNNLDVNDTPIIIQYNKRDIPGVLPVEQLQEALGFEGYPYTEAAAIKGEGVMETFKLVSKITAKHLMARLKGGKSEPVKKATAPGTKDAPARPAKPAPAAPEPEPEPEEQIAQPLSFSDSPTATEAPFNPFADSIGTTPFPDDQPLDAGYETMEEVSLDQLLEGRERPATMSGSIPIPVEALEEVEELDADSVVEEPSVAVALADEPAPMVMPSGDDRVVALEEEVQQLRTRLRVLRDEQRSALESILRELNDLTERVRARLEA
jgi:signal recognition particle receptor subunit beta